MSGIERKPSIKAKSKLLSAAQSSGGPSSVSADATNTSLSADPSSFSAMTTSAARPTAPRLGTGTGPAAAVPTGSRAHSVISVGSGGGPSHPSTPGLPDASHFGGGPPAGEPVQRLKFKPKVPIKRVKQEIDVKPEIPAAASIRGGGPRGRGRGRGAGASRGKPREPVQTLSIAAGPMGGPRAATGPRYGSGGGVAAQSSRYHEASTTEVYSENEDEDVPLAQRAVIDIDAVSGLGESAPTSLVRDRKLNTKLGAKGKERAKKEEKEKMEHIKGKEREKREARSGAAVEEDMEVDDGPRQETLGVKAERISPVKGPTALPDPNEGVPPPIGFREEDFLGSDEEGQDSKKAGKAVQIQEEEEEDEDVNEAQKLDLSESESEDVEDSMEGDFTAEEGYDDPSSKIFMFQFPHLFPKFKSNEPVDMTQDVKEGITDVKPTMAQMRAAKKKGGIPPPQGRIGTLAVMKSGKVKMILGDGIVMDVTPGVSAAFLQQLVHVDTKTKSTVVLGEINKNFVVTPDVDRLLQDLFVGGGKTPGDKEAERRIEMIRIKLEGGLVRMDDD